MGHLMILTSAHVKHVPDVLSVFCFSNNTKVEVVLFLTIGRERLVGPCNEASNKKSSSRDFIQRGNGKFVIIGLNYFEYAKKRVAERINKKGQRFVVNNSALEDSFLVVHIFRDRHH